MYFPVNAALSDAWAGARLHKKLLREYLQCRQQVKDIKNKNTIQGRMVIAKYARLQTEITPHLCHLQVELENQIQEL